MFKNIVTKAMTTMLVASSLAFSLTNSTHAMEEKTPKELDVFSYGGSLTDAQIEETRSIFEITNKDVVEKAIVGNDMQKYLNDSNTTANMYSSAFVSFNKGKGEAIKVDILTPENITGVTSTQYYNAIITSGVTNVDVKIASPVKVTGHSALVGVYGAVDEYGVELDKDRMKVAQEELDLTTSIANDQKENEEFNSEELNKLFIDIKQMLSEEHEKDGEITDEEVEEVVTSAIKDNQLGDFLTEEQIQRISTFANNYKDTDAIIDENVKESLVDLSKNVANQIKDATKGLSDKVSDLNEDGFFDGIKEFFKDLFDMIKGWFTSDEPSKDEISPEDLDNVEPNDSLTV